LSGLWPLEQIPSERNRGIPKAPKISESVGIVDDSGRRAMPKAYSADVRERVIASVESGASRREAAEQFEVSASAAIKWLQSWRRDGRSAARPRGGSRSPLEDHRDRLLALVENQADLTLDEIVAALRKQGVTSSRSAVWRFFDRHGITFKKNPARGRTGSAGRRPGAAPLAAGPGQA
jgi:transposase